MRELMSTGSESKFRLKWTLRLKIGGLVAGLLALLLIGAVSSSARMSKIGDELHELSSIDLPLMSTISEIERCQLEQHIALERLLAGREATADADLATFDERSRRLGELVVTGLAAAKGDAYDGIRTNLEALRKEHRAFEDHARKTLRDVASGTVSEQALAKIEADAAAVDQHVHASLDELGRFTMDAAKAGEEHEAAALRMTVVYALLAVVLGACCSFWVLRRLNHAVQAVTARAEEIRNGRLDGEALEVRSTDEMGQLASVFNDMMASLKFQVRDTRGAMESLSVAANQILAATKEQAATTKQQAATIQEITTSMEEIGQSGSQISERAGRVATSAEASSASSVKGRDAMRETNRNMEAIRAQIEEVAENIVALSEKTQAVSEIIAAVNEVAEQSNLLALNAAIEAAAAGEQGSRFSVVANEIKNLADQAKDSTGQVRRILSDIQKGINGAVMLTEEAVKRAEAGKQTTETTEETIEDLIRGTQESIDAFQQIVAGSNQQQIGITQITQGMQDIRQAAEQSAVGTSQLEKAVADLTTLGSQLQSVVEKYEV